MKNQATRLIINAINTLPVVYSQLMYDATNKLTFEDLSYQKSVSIEEVKRVHALIENASEEVDARLVFDNIAYFANIGTQSIRLSALRSLGCLHAFYKNKNPHFREVVFSRELELILDASNQLLFNIFVKKNEKDDFLAMGRILVELPDLCRSFSYSRLLSLMMSNDDAISFVVKSTESDYLLHLDYIAIDNLVKKFPNHHANLVGTLLRLYHKLYDGERETQRVKSFVSLILTKQFINNPSIRNQLILQSMHYQYLDKAMVLKANAKDVLTLDIIATPKLANYLGMNEGTITYCSDSSSRNNSSSSDNNIYVNPSNKIKPKRKHNLASGRGLKQDFTKEEGSALLDNLIAGLEVTAISLNTPGNNLNANQNNNNATNSDAMLTALLGDTTTEKKSATHYTPANNMINSNNNNVNNDLGSSSSNVNNNNDASSSNVNNNNDASSSNNTIKPKQCSSTKPQVTLT